MNGKTSHMDTPKYTNHLLIIFIFTVAIICVFLFLFPNLLKAYLTLSASSSTSPTAPLSDAITILAMLVAITAVAMPIIFLNNNKTQFELLNNQIEKRFQDALSDQKEELRQQQFTNHNWITKQFDDTKSDLDSHILKQQSNINAFSIILKNAVLFRLSYFNDMFEASTDEPLATDLTTQTKNYLISAYQLELYIVDLTNMSDDIVSDTFSKIVTYLDPEKIQAYKTNRKANGTKHIKDLLVHLKTIQDLGFLNSPTKRSSLLGFFTETLEISEQEWLNSDF